MPDYFTLEEFRRLPQMDDSNKYADEDVERAAAYITAIIERVVGTSFVAREFTKTFRGTAWDVTLPAFLIEVTSTSSGGTALTGPLSFDDPTTVGTWADVQNTTVTYTAGYSTEPPADIKEAAMQATRARLLEKHGTARVQDRASSVAGDAGGTTTYIVAGADHPTGYPEVDAVILGWHRRLFSLGFA